MYTYRQDTFAIFFLFVLVLLPMQMTNLVGVYCVEFPSILLQVYISVAVDLTTCAFNIQLAVVQ